ncbi:MAG: transposase [Spirochaetes bacterium]|nr:MAG: transposase [Spirochaetota bacterium]
MYRVHKIRLEPNDKQATGLSKAAGVSRFAYNWGLARWTEQYAEYRDDKRDAPPSQLSLRRELNAIKREEFPWMLESTKCAPQEALINLGKAFDNFFKKRGKYPSFKKRGVHDAFKLSSGQFSVDTTGGVARLRIPKVGCVRLSETPRFDGEPVSVTISRRAGRWFASLMFRITDNRPSAHTSPEVVGIDLGIRELVLSTGDHIQVPREYRRRERQLRRAQQSLSRKDKGSKNRARAKAKVARLHYRTACVRENWQHQVTCRVTRDFGTVVLEDLNVKGMTKNRSLAKSVADVGFGELRRQIEYKAARTGAVVVVADRWFPSSKMCNVCGTKTKSLPLSIREWTCAECGIHHDRDLNAAINLRNLAVSSTVTACGEFLSSGSWPVTVVAQDASVKQESDSRVV